MKIEDASQVPPQLREALREYLIALADDELLIGHRDSEWTGHAPILEEDIAFANLAQDELGHALTWYTLAHELGAPEPDRAVFFREADEYRNATLVELPRGDWAVTIVRQYLFDAAEQARYASLAASAYQPIADAVAKLHREEKYHILHSRGWVQRLGDATDESHARMQAAVDMLWPHASGLFEPLPGEAALVAANIKSAEDALSAQWLSSLAPVLLGATLSIPGSAPPVWGGRTGQHTVHMSALLGDLQKVARSQPEATW